MCFSFEISLFTGLFSWTTGFYLLSKNLMKYQRYDIIRLLIFSSMQFVDAILWHIKMIKNNINYFLTSVVIPFILSLQLIYNLIYVNKFDNIFTKLLLLIITIYLFKRFNGYSVSSCDNSLSSPVWGEKEIELWELIIFLFLFIYRKNLHIKYYFIHLILLLSVYFIYKKALGSIWCSLANIYAIFYLIKY